MSPVLGARLQELDTARRPDGGDGGAPGGRIGLVPHGHVPVDDAGCLRHDSLSFPRAVAGVTAMFQSPVTGESSGGAVRDNGTAASRRRLERSSGLLIRGSG